MSTPRNISKRELDAIKQSVAAARALLFNQTTLAARLKKVLPLKKGQTVEQNMAERTLLWLEAGQNRDLSDPTYREVLTKAAERNDHRFFIRLGRILSGRPYTLESVMEDMPQRKLEWFLVQHWADKWDGLPELFHLTPKGLVDVILHQQKCRVTEDAVVKIRQRLGLKAFRGKKISVGITGGKLTFSGSPCT